MKRSPTRVALGGGVDDAGVFDPEGGMEGIKEKSGALNSKIKPEAPNSMHGRIGDVRKKSRKLIRELAICDLAV